MEIQRGILRPSKSTTSLRPHALRRCQTSEALLLGTGHLPERTLDLPMRAPTAQQEDRGDSSSDSFHCNICLESARNAIVTSCGHLFCWACLYSWLITPAQLHCPMCPVCKAGCEVSSLTPIYDNADTSQDLPSPPQLTASKSRTFSSSSQSKPKNVFDQWLVPHIHPPSLAILPDGSVPARPVARPRPVNRKQPRYPPHANTSHVHTAGLFGGAHPIVLFSAGITTLCGMQFFQNGGFGNDLAQETFNTSRMLTLLAFFIIAGVWFH
ncbi:hypothetical protein BCR37DRAFT_377967 [Protomyces lactucae-debilis]|uniref:RING-type E3 ubiquitin transferase n=1 Tax=Protomyces lactucae-debilis TaxID=2754530 RepID=A0A1Y2FNU1_PROLT|nr:uncharacterized protein BCR37DRAFT_377967 [Protomyces lactucae-debilis]ORY84994.1 hypothetical protein BCR37DRAFT_377967 [Protomyces lactucae-debilis]